MVLHLLFSKILPLIVLVTAPTAPPVYPPEDGRPKDMKNCRINSDTVLPWIVGIWNSEVGLFIGHGSMITHNAILSTCRQYAAPHTSYKVIGQYIWNMSLPDDPCMQTKSVTTIIKHPKCIESPKMATFFDFAILTIENGWDITGPNYPTTAFADNPYEQLSVVQNINILPETTGCTLTHFKLQEALPPRLNFDSFVQAIKFHSECVQLLCEKIPPNQTFSTMCQKRLGERAIGTMLCLISKTQRRINFGVSPNSYWYAGTPLVCNGTTYGIAAQGKDRQQFLPPKIIDIHFVVTLLRVWFWLIQQMEDHSVPWVTPIFVEDMSLVPDEYPTQKFLPIEYGDLQPYSSAVMTRPLSKISIFLLTIQFLPIGNFLFY